MAADVWRRVLRSAGNQAGERRRGSVSDLAELGGSGGGSGSVAEVMGLG